MTPKSFSGLFLLPNFNDGHATVAVTMQYDHPAVEPRHVETIGGSFFDTRNTQKSKQKPSKRTIKFLLRGGTPDGLHAYINHYEFFDKGEKGTLLFDGDDGFEYSCTAVLEKVGTRFLYDTPTQSKAEITLTFQELTVLAKVAI